MRPFLLDTCAAIWITQDETLAESATHALHQANALGVPTYLSPITAWEIGQLVSLRRMQLPVTPLRWFESLVEQSNVRLAAIAPQLLIAASFLPGKPPRDPADRILAATARDLGATLVTRDRVLLQYGEQGHINTIAC